MRIKMNRMKMEFRAISANESLARMTAAAFMTPLNPTLEQISDVKTAVSEAVTNAIIHGYGEDRESDEMVEMSCYIEKEALHITICDEGVGIENIDKAMEPLYTTRPELERSGMGFSFMEAFMDELKVESEPGKGTKVHMVKKIGPSSWAGREEE